MKKELRNELRARLSAISCAARHERSIFACQRLIALPEFRTASSIMIFLSTAQEIDTSAIALAAWASGKRVLVPKVSYEQRRMIPVTLESLTEHIAHDAMGIREPIGGMPATVGELDLVIVPGLGFDQHGNRLGRGAGFYDRFLSHREYRAVSCALAFEDQVFPQLPHDEHDMRVHVLVTDAAVRRFDTPRADASRTSSMDMDQP